MLVRHKAYVSLSLAANRGFLYTNYNFKMQSTIKCRCTLLTEDSYILIIISECNRPSNGCKASHDRYRSVDCDGDGVMDHVCTTTVNSNRWLVLSSEGCPNNWGTELRPVSKCEKGFGKGYIRVGKMNVT